MNCAKNTPIVGDLQTIGIKRGTTRAFNFRLVDADGQPIMVQAEKVYFVVKKSWDAEEAIIKKSLDDMTFDENGYYHFQIEAEDTETQAYGKYVWDLTAYVGSSYRTKPASGYLIIGNSSGWIANEKGT